MHHVPLLFIVTPCPPSLSAELIFTNFFPALKVNPLRLTLCMRKPTRDPSVLTHKALAEGSYKYPDLC